MVKVVTLLAILIAATAHAEPAITYKRIYVRAGVLHMMPLTRSNEVQLADVRGPASLAITNGPIAGSGATLDSLTVPAVIAGYTLPALDDRLSIEMVLGAPIHVTFRATGSLADMSIAPDALGIPTGVPALGSELGEADAAPPLVTLTYRVADLGPVHPYAGAGVALLVTYNAHATNPVLTEASAPTFDVDPGAGLVVQSGLDLHLWRSVVARLDVKYVAFMKAHATVEHLRVNTPGLPIFETTDVGTATMELWVNPLIVQLGVGVDF